MSQNKLKTKIIIGLIVLLPGIGFSQGEWNKWYFGKNIAVDFSSGSPVLLPNIPMQATGMSACIADSLGNILFYSSGMKIWDRTNAVMPNGTGLLGITGSYQPVFVVPSIPYDSTYFVFTIGNQGLLPPQYGLHYSKVDLRLNGGFGDVVTGMKNIPVPGGDSAYSALTGIRHYNNRDVWIVIKDQRGSLTYSRYLSYLVSPSGINTIPEISSSLVLNKQMHGQYATNIRISQDGTKLFSSDVDPDETVAEICDFNNITGKVTPLFTFLSTHDSIEYRPYSAEFSMNSNFLYTINYDTIISSSSSINQYDLSRTDSADFMQNEVVLGYGARNLRLSSDGEIYLSAEINGISVDSFHVINNPTLQGAACNLQKNVIGFNGNWVQHSLPQFLQRYKAYIHYSGECQNIPIESSCDIYPPADSIHWDFGDPASGTANYSNDSTPTHIYTLPGQYTVELFVRHIDNRTDTSWITITIHETPNPELGNDQTICLGDSVVLDAGLCLGCVYEWGSIPPGFFSNEQIVTINQTGLYTVEVTSPDECRGRDTIQLVFVTQPVVTNNPLSKSICSGESTNIPLTSNVPGTGFSWTAIGSSPFVTGFSPGSGDTIDQVLSNTGSGPETVIYTITPVVGNCVGDSVQFVVTVTTGDSVVVSISSSTDSICAGTPVIFTASPINAGANPLFQWFINGVDTNFSDSVFTYIPNKTDTVYCVVTSLEPCRSNNPDTSNSLVIHVLPNLPVSVNVTPSENPVCEGESVTLTASVTNGGMNPVYQWYLNNLPVGTNDSTYTFIPFPGDRVSCLLTSSEQCTTNNPATSDTITMTVNPLLPVSISIAPSANPVCGGIPVTFTAIPINGGGSPGFQWQVNGANAGTNHNYTYLPVDGDVLSCILTSNEDCVTGNPATSNSIIMSIGEQPDVSFSVCFDTITTINAKPFKLRGGIPLRGTYSGPGVDQITGYFNPAMAGLGTKTISYSYTNWYSCSDNEVRSITVINPSPFTCGNSLTDIRDNKVYSTILIGSQCWLASNLNHGQQINGSLAQRDNCLVEKYCYKELATSCAQQGALYQWDELMRFEDVEEIQGLCPPGWHVPSEADWNTLFTNWTNNAFAGAPLKYSGYSGFNALLTGAGLFNRVWEFDAFATFFWSSTSHGPWKAWAHGMNDYNYSVSYYPSYRANAFSVRCVGD